MQNDANGSECGKQREEEIWLVVRSFHDADWKSPLSRNDSVGRKFVLTPALSPRRGRTASFWLGGGGGLRAGKFMHQGLMKPRGAEGEAGFQKLLMLGRT